MKKITLLLLFLLVSVSGYSQLYGNTEGFESPAPTGPLPQTWALGTGNWAIFERNTPTTVVSTQNWGINAFAATPIPYEGLNCASVSREQIGAGSTSEDFLATSLVSVPATGVTELHFWTRMFTSGNQGTIFKVMVASAAQAQNDPNSYIDVQQWTEPELIVPTTNFNVWTEKTVIIPSFLAGQDIYLAFVKVYTQPTTSLDGDRWLIDKVGVNSQCTAPVPGTTNPITSTGATLTWTNPGGASSFHVVVTPTAGGTSIPYDFTTAPYVITSGLTPNTQYNYTVTGVCSSGFSSPASATSANFTTQIAPPVCGGNLVDSGGPTANYSNNENISTTVNPVNPGDVVTVTFTAFNTQAGQDILRIYDGSSATAPFLLATLSGTTLPPSYTSTAANGSLTFVFTSNGTTTALGYAANITCNPAPACRVPTAVSSASPTTTSVILNWTQPANPDLSVASTFDIIALPCGSPAPNAASTPTANDVTASAGPSYTLTGLTPATCYDIYIRAVCAGNSGWNIVPATVSTLVAPPVCGGNFVDTGGISGNYGNNQNLTTTICPVNTGDAVTVTFTAFNTEAGADILQVYDGNSATGTTLLATLSGTALPPSFTSSSPNGCLTFVFTSNGTVNALGWLANVTCAPQPGCAAPTVFTSNTVTHNSVVLNWTQPANPDTTVSTSWQVYAVPCGSPAPTAASTPTATVTTAPPYTLTGLTPLTCYDIYVRSSCGSTISGPRTITTLAAPPECGGNFVDAGGTTANYAGSSNVTTVICPTNSGDAVTVTFTSFATEVNFDALYVYDGNAVVPANIIPSANPAANVPGGLAGGYWGTTNPGPFTSSAANGCLTFVFRSDPSVQLAGWLANITCGPPPPCRKPTTLSQSGITSNSVVLNWTQPTNPDNSVASTWEVIALSCGSPAPTATATPTATVTTAPPYTLTGLTSATCYDIYIRAVCSTTDSSVWAGPITITTLVAPPVCGGNFVDAAGPSANYAASSNVTTIICPTNPGDVVTVTFSSFATEVNFDALYVYDGNAVVPANLIPSVNPAANVPGGLAGGYWGTTNPGPFTSSAANGCLTFVFRSDPSVQLGGWVSTVTCGPPPTCRKPTAIGTSAITHNSVILNWTQPTNPDNTVASAWEIIALPCGSPAPTATSIPTATVTSAPPYTLTGLTSATCYDIYIRAVCSTTDSSAWGGPATITTLVAPPVCGGNFVDAAGPSANYAASSNVTTIICPTNPGEIVTVTFTSFSTEVNFDALYVYDGNTVTPSALLATANPAANVPGGLAGGYWGNTIPGPFTSTTSDGCLTFVFRSDPSVQLPGWVSNITCSPAPTCAKPTALIASNISQTSATLTWVQPANPDGSSATAWEVLVLPAGSPIPTGPGIPVTSTTYIANGLAPGTAYVFYVRAICSPTDASIWASLNFAALPTNDECTNATFAIVNQNLNCVQTTHGTLSGATGSLPATTCPGNANDDVWFTFTATAVTHVISFNNVAPATTLDYAIFQGNNCGALTQVGCNSGANLVPGTTYYIRVYSDTAVPQFTNFDLCIGTLPCTEAPAFCTGQTVTYANATNVPSLGTIGCLFTSPNPAFFFLQVNQAGPLSYLISQVDNGGTPRDVDYVAWGPFTDLNTACSGVPANPLPGLIPALTPAQGCAGTLHACSYSANPTEIMCIPNAQLCQVYVIMITNFSNQAGTVTFTQTNAGGGTTECFPINTFNYPQTYYCQNQPNPTPVLSPGATSGTYTSTAGLVIDPVTGTIDLLASTPGAYIVTSTTLTSTGGVCTNIPSITTTRTVVITAPANATISYPAATYCNSIFTTQSVVRTGTSGGTYSSSPAGLLLNATTGEIVPGPSNPGIYTVTYTIPSTGGCAAFTTTTQVEILAAPVLTQTSVAACDTFTLPALAVGNYYPQAGGLGTPLDITVPITSTQPVYIYATATNGCISERQFNVTINTVPTPTFTVTQSSCTTPSGSITVTAPVSGGAPLPSNLFISEVTDADTGSLSYVELYNATGAPVNLTNYKLKFYTWGSPPTAENLQCDLQLVGTIPNNSTNVIKVSSNANITGVVPNQSFNGCAGVNNNDNIRLTTASGTEIDVWGTIDGSIYTPAGQTGYTYRRLNTSTIPSTTWIPADWTSIDPEDYTNIGSYSYTVSTYQYSIDNGAFQTNPLFSNVAPGTHILIVKDVTTGCLSAPVNVVIDPVNPVPSVTAFTYATPVCQNAIANPTPDVSATGFTTGGTFTSNPAANIDLNAATGEITLANTAAGTYVITYAVPFNPATCGSASSTSFTIVINPVITPVVGFSFTTPICKNAQATLSPTLVSGFTTGGVFSSTPSLSINASTGVIDLANANTVAGSYTITYSVAANASTCQVANSATFNIVINPVITLVTSFNYDSPFCQLDNTGNFQSPNLTTNFATGGTFTSTTGLSIAPTTGIIDLQNSTPGTYTVTYTANPNASLCQVATPGTAQVSIIGPIAIALTGGCQSVYVLTANPVNGSFNPETASYVWYNAQGPVPDGNAQSLNVPAVGSYTVKITVDGCETESAPFEVTTIACQIQRGISVNNDGLNDTFDLTGFDVKKLTIFNRLGMEVYSRANYVNEWGGKSDNGDELPDGTYFYVIDKNTGKTETGWIYINRAQ